MSVSAWILPALGTELRINLGDEAPHSVRHRHNDVPVSVWTIKSFEGDVMHLEGRAVDCELNTVMNGVTRYRDVTWQITLDNDDREVLAAYAA